MTAAVAPVPVKSRPRPVSPVAVARLLRIELRRSAMPLVLPVIAVIFWFDCYRISAALPRLWTMRLFYVLGQGHALVDFAPFVAGAAAWMGSRDGRRGMADLVTITAGPRWEAQLATWAAAVCWAVGFYAILVGALLTVTARSVSWGSPPWWSVVVDGVGVVAFTSAGFAAGARFPGRFTAPVAAFGALFAMGMSAQIGFSQSSGWALILPTNSNGNFGQDAGIFYQFLPDLPIARVIFLAGAAAALVGLLGLPASAGGPWLRRSAAVVTAAGLLAAGAGAGLAASARPGPYGMIIPALHDAASDQSVRYTPVCSRAGIPVCVQPAYQPYLTDLTAGLRPVLGEVAGLPGAPARTVQVATVFAAQQAVRPVPGYVGQIVTLGGRPPVLAIPAGALGLPGIFGAGTPDFIGQIRLESLHAFVTSGRGLGNLAQQAVLAALLVHAGIPLSAQPSVLAASPWALPGKGQSSARPVAAAARRFAAQSPTARHAWLVAHLAALRSGRLTLGQLP